MTATCDRGEIIHFAGRHRLSPALRDGNPALAAQGESGGRCGWAEFFAALGERRLALEMDAEGAGHRFVPCQHRRLWPAEQAAAKPRQASGTSPPDPEP